MKKFAKLLVVALAVAVIAGMFAFSASAAATEPGADPTTLKPGSDRVIFIQDAPRDPDTHEIIGDLPGDGTGMTPENPLEPLEHADFNAEADIPKYHLTTSFYQATEMLKDTGGTIVITGPIYFGRKEAYGSSNTQADVFTAKFGNNVIKFTSVYNGVDYRETNGAKITIEMPAMISVEGSSIWENVTIETLSNDRSLNFEYYSTLIGQGVKCAPADSLLAEVASAYVSLSAGHRYAKSTGENPTLTVQSGTYNKIIAGMWGATTSVSIFDCTPYLTIEGTTRVMGMISGTVQALSPFESKSINITINDGVFECDINGVGPTGLSNKDGVVNLKINGGNFGNAWSISSTGLTNSGNAPAAMNVDFSGWKGEELGLAYAVALAAAEESGVSNIVLPEGSKSVDELVKFAADNPPAPPETTTEAAPVITMPPAEDTTKKDEPAESTPDTTAAAPGESSSDTTTTKAPAADPAVTTSAGGDADSGSEFPWAIVVIIAAVVVVGVVVVVIVMKKKGSKN